MTQGRHDPYYLARLEWEKPVLVVPEGPFPLAIAAQGPMGGKTERWVASSQELNTLHIPSGIISDKDPNPPRLEMLPKLCPRLQLASGKKENTRAYVYQGQDDSLNHIPMVQLSEGDAWRGEQYRSYSGMDGRNVLMLKKISLRYDYEDSAIVDYRGVSPKTGKTESLHEKNSGFYANLHYAVVPFREEYRGWNDQQILHLAQGSLAAIGLSQFAPQIRTHSFLPGPFLSRSGSFYEMCEWGDTAYQAPLQELEYEDMALWDFDYLATSEPLMLIVFESDHEDHLLQQRLIPKNYLVDDLVGVFEIKKEDLKKSLTLKNSRGDFEITLQSGDLPHPPTALWKAAIGMPWRGLY